MAVEDPVVARLASVSPETAVVAEHLHADDVVLVGEKVFLDLAQDILLRLGQLAMMAQLVDQAADGSMDALFMALQRRADRRTANEADDVGRDGCAIAARDGVGELALGEVERAELLAQDLEVLHGEVLRPRADDLECLDLVAVLAHPCGEGLEVVLRPRLALAVAVVDPGDLVGVVVDDDALARAVDGLERLDGGAVRQEDGARLLRLHILHRIDEGGQ